MKKKLDAEAELLEACGRYLKTKRWTALVASVNRIMGPLDRHGIIFELVIRFTGGQEPKKGGAHPMFDGKFAPYKPHSEETKAKMREARRR